MNTIGMRPLVDFELFAEGNARENDNLRDLRHSRVTRHVGEANTPESPLSIRARFLVLGRWGEVALGRMR